MPDPVNPRERIAALLYEADPDHQDTWERVQGLERVCFRFRVMADALLAAPAGAGKIEACSCHAINAKDCAWRQRPGTEPEDCQCPCHTEVADNLRAQLATATARALQLETWLRNASQRAEQAEARVRALEGALNEDVAGAPVTELLLTVARHLYQQGGGPLEDRVRALADTLAALLQADPSRAPGGAACWLIERTDGPRPRWLAWRDRDAISWTPDAHEADRYDWWMPASRDARLIAATQGVACVAVEHMFVASRAPGGA